MPEEKTHVNFRREPCGVFSIFIGKGLAIITRIKTKIYRLGTDSTLFYFYLLFPGITTLRGIMPPTTPPSILLDFVHFPLQFGIPQFLWVLLYSICPSLLLTFSSLWVSIRLPLLSTRSLIFLCPINLIVCAYTKPITIGTFIIESLWFIFNANISVHRCSLATGVSQYFVFERCQLVAIPRIYTLGSVA